MILLFASVNGDLIDFELKDISEMEDEIVQCIWTNEGVYGSSTVDRS